MFHCLDKERGVGGGGGQCPSLGWSLWRRRITVTSSFNDKSTDHLRIRAMVNGGGFTPSALPLSTLYSRLLNRYLKTTYRFFLHTGYLLGSGGDSAGGGGESWEKRWGSWVKGRSWGETVILHERMDFRFYWSLVIMSEGRELCKWNLNGIYGGREPCSWNLKEGSSV